MHVRALDKQRFVNLDAPSDSYEVHSVELSDNRSVRHFITLFLKNRTPRQDGWVYLSGLRNYTHHDPETYHREDKKTTWIRETFPSQGPPWTNHYHVTLDHMPGIEDLVPFRDQIPPTLLDEIQRYINVE